MLVLYYSSGKKELHPHGILPAGRHLSACCLKYFFNNVIIPGERKNASREDTMTANSKNVHEVLQLMKTLEGETAALYSQISGHASAANPAFADMFSVLAKEEEIHMKYFDMLADVQENENAPFLGKKETLENIDELHAQMHRQIKYISANIAKLTEVEIVKLVLVIENNLLEKHRGFLIKIFDESLLKLFKALEFGDESHQKKLQQFLAEHP